MYKEEDLKSLDWESLDLFNWQIPLESWVCYVCAPPNAGYQSAAMHTGRFEVRQALQRRQISKDNIDGTYTVNLFKNMKHQSVEEREHARLFCGDDKNKASVGEPGHPVSTGVRGGKALGFTKAETVAADHDWHKASVIQSALLEVDILERADSSFYRGQLSVTWKDAVFEPSNPTRHMAEFLQYLLQSPSLLCLVLFFYSDGGADHCIKHVRVWLAWIALIILAGRKGIIINMIKAGRPAANWSWVDPVEHCMSILNLGLNASAYARLLGAAPFEQTVGQCDSMDAIRAAARADPEFEEQWRQSMKGPIDQMRSRI